MKKDDRLHVVLTPAERAAVKAKAAELEMSMSAFTRLAIRGLLRRGLVMPPWDPKPK